MKAKKNKTVLVVCSQIDKNVRLCKEQVNAINRYIIDASAYIPYKVKCTKKWQMSVSNVLMSLGIGIKKEIKEVTIRNKVLSVQNMEKVRKELDKLKTGVFSEHYKVRLYSKI